MNNKLLFNITCNIRIARYDDISISLVTCQQRQDYATIKSYYALHNIIDNYSARNVETLRKYYVEYSTFQQYFQHNVREMFMQAPCIKNYVDLTIYHWRLHKSSWKCKTNIGSS